MNANNGWMKELYVVETYFSWLLSACASLKCTCGSIWNRTTKSVSCWWLRLSLGHSTSFSPLRNAGECCQLVSYILKFSAKRCVQILLCQCEQNSLFLEAQWGQQVESKNGKRLKVNTVKKNCNYFRFLTDIFQFVNVTYDTFYQWGLLLFFFLFFSESSQ